MSLELINSQFMSDNFSMLRPNYAPENILNIGFTTNKSEMNICLANYIKIPIEPVINEL